MLGPVKVSEIYPVYIQCGIKHMPARVLPRLSCGKAEPVSFLISLDDAILIFMISRKACNQILFRHSDL